MIRELQPGPCDFPAMVVSAVVKTAKNGSPFLMAEVRDKSGSITMRIFGWDAKWDTPKAGNFIQITGEVEKYQEKLQVRGATFSYLDSVKQVNANDFMAVSERPAPKMHTELIEKVQARIKHEGLRAMLLEILQTESLKNALLIAPAAKQNHDAVRGGLLAHILDIWGLAEGAVSYYGDTLNSDVLFASCILHDIGKVKELSPEAGFAYTQLGDMAGHILIGAHLLFAYSKKHKLPEDLANRLIHVVASHHHRDLQPKTMEAWVFGFLDNCAAKVSAIRQALAEDATGAAKVYVPMLKGEVYRPEDRR